MAPNEYHGQCHFISWKTGSIEVPNLAGVMLMTFVYCFRRVLAVCVCYWKKRLVDKSLMDSV